MMFAFAIAASALVLVVLALVLALGFVLIRHYEAESDWQQERRELLTRIQRPDLVPVAPMPEFELPESEPDEIGLIGTIADPPESE